MRVLIACEESQTSCIAFRERGHEAYSCDIQECSGGRPEWHIQGDALALLNGNCSFATQDGAMHQIDGKWDLVIAHPPCTYLTSAGATRMFPNHKLNEERFAKGLEAKAFFMEFYEYGMKGNRICIENPTPMHIFELPRFSQIVNPYQFGEPWQKRTALWCMNIPLLKPTKILTEYQSWVSGGSFSRGGQKRPRERIGVAHNQKQRSKSFKGIAEAMADQWGKEEMEDEQMSFFA